MQRLGRPGDGRVLHCRLRLQRSAARPAACATDRGPGQPPGQKKHRPRQRQGASHSPPLALPTPAPLPGPCLTPCLTPCPFPPFPPSPQGTFSDSKGNVIFDTNDFDETWPASYLYDVYRLAASIVLVARDWKVKDEQVCACVGGWVGRPGGAWSGLACCAGVGNCLRAPAPPGLRPWATWVAASATSAPLLAPMS